MLWSYGSLTALTMAAEAVTLPMATASVIFSSIPTRGESAATFGVDGGEEEERGENGQNHHDDDLHVENVSGSSTQES